MHVITGFHAIEELLRSCEKQCPAAAHKNCGQKTAPALHILYEKTGPRIKKILAQAEALGISAEQSGKEQLLILTQTLPEYLRDHRGIVLIDSRPQKDQKHQSSSAVFAELAVKETALVVILDSITDPHNTGAIIRSAEQFAADVVILPERRSAGDFQTISKVSAGAASWVPLVYTANLVRAVENLKKSGFWIFGADAAGEPLPGIRFPPKTVLIMGSEGSGISRLLKTQCDSFAAIPSQGKLDSLNVSVAAGILLYAITQQR